MENLSSYNQQKRHQKPSWAKKVMPLFVRESKKEKSCGSKRLKPTHADTHSQPLNDKS